MEVPVVTAVVSVGLFLAAAGCAVGLRRQKTEEPKLTLMISLLERLDR